MGQLPNLWIYTWGVPLPEPRKMSVITSGNPECCQSWRMSSAPPPKPRHMPWLGRHEVLDKWLASGWVSKDPTLICLLSCVGNFSSSTSLTAALPRNKSMVMPGGSNPWCCCHFRACEQRNIHSSAWVPLRTSPDCSKPARKDQVNTSLWPSEDNITNAAVCVLGTHADAWMQGTLRANRSVFPYCFS